MKAEDGREHVDLEDSQDGRGRLNPALFVRVIRVVGVEYKDSFAVFQEQQLKPVSFSECYEKLI